MKKLIISLVMLLCITCRYSYICRIIFFRSMNNKFTTAILLCFGWLFTTAQNNPAYERVWATYFGGQNTAVIDSAIDENGYIYMAGYVSKDDESNYLDNFTTSGAYQTQYGGGVTDGFLAKFSSEGLLIWATYFGGNNSDWIFSVAITEDRYIIIGGTTGSSGLATLGTHQNTFAGEQDVFIAKFHDTGELMWCTYYGGEKHEFLRDLDTDIRGNIYITGQTQSPTGIATSGTFQSEYVFPEGDSYQNTNFVAKFDKFGQREWGTYYGDDTYDENGQIVNNSVLSAIAVNGSGVFVTGEVYQTSNSNYYFGTPNSHQPIVAGATGAGHEMFLSKFDLDNGQREWSTYYGGSGLEYGISLQSGEDFTRNRHNLVASENYVYLAGSTWSNNNIATSGSLNPNKTSILAHFIAKFDNLGNRIWGTYLGEANIAQTQIEYALSFFNPPLFNFYPMRIALSLDEDENVIASGSTVINNLSSDESYQQTKNTNCNCTDAYSTKISSDGTNLIYGTYYGGEYNETATKTLSFGDDFYITGTTQSYYDIATSDSFQEELNFMTATNNPLPFNGFLAKFSPLPPLSTNEINTSKSLIYPNPNNGSFFVNLNENYISGELFLYDLNGKLVYNTKIDNITTHIQTGILLKGVYLLRINSNRQDISHFQKIIIE